MMGIERLWEWLDGLCWGPLRGSLEFSRSDQLQEVLLRRLSTSLWDRLRWPIGGFPRSRLSAQFRNRLSTQFRSQLLAQLEEDWNDG